MSLIAAAVAAGDLTTNNVVGGAILAVLAMLLRDRGLDRKSRDAMETRFSATIEDGNATVRDCNSTVLKVQEHCAQHMMRGTSYENRELRQQIAANKKLNEDMGS